MYSGKTNFLLKVVNLIPTYIGRRKVRGWRHCILLIMQDHSEEISQSTEEEEANFFENIELASNIGGYVC